MAARLRGLALQLVADGALLHVNVSGDSAMLVSAGLSDDALKLQTQHIVGP